MKSKGIVLFLPALLTVALITGCYQQDPQKNLSQRQILFIGVDISASFKRSPHFKDSLNFLANYIYCHMQGLGDLEKPERIFIASIGGLKLNDPKAFIPLEQTFHNASIKEIRTKLRRRFTKKKSNPYTDFNAFFQQIESTVEERKLILRPINIIMVSDGVPDTGGKEPYRNLNLAPLEKLSRNLTIRLLYPNSNVSRKWKTKVKRRRVKLWIVEDEAMREWNGKNIIVPKKPIYRQNEFFRWIKNNVDFPARVKRVN